MVLFLDIDGVVLPSGHEHPPRDVILTLRLIRDRGWKIVLISSWRTNKADAAFELLNDIGCAVDAVVDPECVSKRTAIVEWLIDEYGDEWPARLVVVDDYPIAPIDGVTIVRIDASRGLTIDQVRRALGSPSLAA